MKIPFSLSLLSVAVLANTALGQTILVDYAGRTGSNTTVLSGDFGSTATSAGSTVTDWDPIPPLSDFEINTNLASGVGTSANAVIGTNSSGDPLDFGLSTGYTLSEGDTFDISYMWRDAANWDDGSDLVTLELFYTDDNTLTGSRTNVFSLTSALSQSPNAWQTESANGVAGNNLTGIDSLNKTLFIAVTTNTDNSEFARFDNVYIQAIPVPEPSVGACIVASLGFMLTFGRHRRA